MEFTTLIGIIAGLVLVTIAIYLGGTGVRIFWDVPSVLITMGGAAASVIVNFPVSRLKDVAKVTRAAFRRHSSDPAQTIGLLVGLAEKARREGLLALDDMLKGIEDPFLKKGIQLVVDGTDPSLVRDILETDISFLEERHKEGRKVFLALASYCPAYGMIGTLIGLVQMLRNLNDPSKIGPGLAVALITTLYGAILAYLVFTPLAGKLEIKSGEEILEREMALEGILSIQSGDNPRIVEEKLRAFIAPGARSKAILRREIRQGETPEVIVP